MNHFHAEPVTPGTTPTLWGEDTLQIVDTRNGSQVISYCHRDNAPKLVDALNARPVTLREAAVELARTAIDNEGSDPSQLALEEAANAYVENHATYLDATALYSAARHLVANAVTTITFPEEGELEPSPQPA